MRCKQCQHGHTHRGQVTITLACGAGSMVFKNVPAQICDECGEEFLSPRIAHRLLARADRAANREF